MSDTLYIYVQYVSTIMSDTVIAGHKTNKKRLNGHSSFADHQRFSNFGAL